MYFPEESTTAVVFPTGSTLQDLSSQHQHQHSSFDLDVFIGRDNDKQDVQETDNEALSSLLMLSKSNTDPNGKDIEDDDEDDEDENDAIEFHNSGNTGMINRTNMLPDNQMVKRNVSPLNERTVRGENQPLSKSVRIEDLRRFFHLPIVEVARQLGTCTTALKKICRKNKISKWPYRQIRSITKSIQSLEMASLNDTLNEELKMQYREQIVTLQNAIDDLIRDPNKIVTLVNMGLSEDLTKNAERAMAMHANAMNGSSSAMLGGVGASSGMAGPGMMAMMPWPKPSADVQQIMQAAAAMNAQNLDSGAGRPPRPQKRKLNSSMTNLSDNVMESSQVGIQSGNNYQGIVNAMRTNNQMIPFSSSSNALSDAQQQAFESMSNDDEDDDDDDTLTGGDQTDNLRSKTVDIGLTQVQCELNVENQKLQFSGPVQLAPLQRKKLRPNVTRKVVPLMEPDIGSNFNIEFVPQFVLNMLNKSMLTSGGASGNGGGVNATSHGQHESTRLQLMDGNTMQGLLEGGQSILAIQNMQTTTVTELTGGVFPAAEEEEDDLLTSLVTDSMTSTAANTFQSSIPVAINSVDTPLNQQTVDSETVSTQM